MKTVTSTNGQEEKSLVQSTPTKEGGIVMNDKIKVACYCRVSTKKEEQELSLENQERFFRAYADQQGLEIYHLYKDDGISAKSMKKRDDFNRMVSDAKKGLFSRILVKDISRFARNTYDFLGVIRELKSGGIQVDFVTANMTTQDSEFTLTILAAVAQEESSNLSKRVKFSKKQSAQAGRVPNFVYGYNKRPGEKYTLDINEAEARTVRRVFELYITEQMSTGAIAKLLNQEGVPTKKGGKYKWTQCVVSNILRNQIYIGKVCNNKSESVNFMDDSRKIVAEDSWVVVERPELRLIPDEVYEQAKKIRESRRTCFNMYQDGDTMRMRTPSIRYPLSNLLRCANDGYSFRRRVRTYDKSGYTYTYWTCSKRDYGASECDNTVKVDEGQMHRMIAGFLLTLAERREILLSRFEKVMEQKLKARYENEYDYAKLTAEQKRLTAQQAKLMDLYLEDGISKDVLVTKQAELDRQLKRLEVSLDVCTSHNQVPAEVAHGLALMIDTIENHVEDLLSNAFLKTIFEKFVVHEDGRITAVIKVDRDTGDTVEIPFCEVLEGTDVSVPNHTNDIQRPHRPAAAHGELAGEDGGQRPGLVYLP